MGGPRPNAVGYRIISRRWASTDSAAAAAVPPRDPKLELFDVRDKESDGGTLVRLTFNGQEKVVVLSIYPQLGDRKQGTPDPSPQFDFSRRASLRLSAVEIASLIAVAEGRYQGTKPSGPTGDRVERPDDRGGYRFVRERHSITVTMGRHDLPSSLGGTQMCVCFEASLSRAANSTGPVAATDAARNHFIVAPVPIHTQK